MKYLSTIYLNKENKKMLEQYPYSNSAYSFSRKEKENFKEQAFLFNNYYDMVSSYNIFLGRQKCIFIKPIYSEVYREDVIFSVKKTKEYSLKIELPFTLIELSDSPYFHTVYGEPLYINKEFIEGIIRTEKPNKSISLKQ